jgi:general secretion pathway protein J
LIEVLVALALMALMAAMAWRAIDGMARVQQATHEHTDAVLTLQAGLDQWRADLDAMMVFWPQPADGQPPGGNGSAAAARSLAWDGSVLRFTRAESSGAGVRVVAWARRPGDGQWLRWQSAPLISQTAWSAAWDAAARWGQAGAPAPAPGAPVQAVPIVPITGWQLYYFRRNAWTNPLSSDAETAGGDSATNNPVPDGVRLVLTLAPGSPLSGAMQIDWVRPTLGGRS